MPNPSRHFAGEQRARDGAALLRPRNRRPPRYCPWTGSEALEAQLPRMITGAVPDKSGAAPAIARPLLSTGEINDQTRTTCRDNDRSGSCRGRRRCRSSKKQPAPERASTQWPAFLRPSQLRILNRLAYRRRSDLHRCRPRDRRHTHLKQSSCACGHASGGRVKLPGKPDESMRRSCLIPPGLDSSDPRLRVAGSGGSLRPSSDRLCRGAELSS